MTRLKGITFLVISFINRIHHLPYIYIVFIVSIRRRAIRLWKSIWTFADSQTTWLEFKECHYDIISNISKAFHHIKIHDDGQKYVKLLWINSKHSSLPISIVILESICCPYLPQQGLTTHLAVYMEGPSIFGKLYLVNFMNMNESKCSLNSFFFSFFKQYAFSRLGKSNRPFKTFIKSISRGLKTYLAFHWILKYTHFTETEGNIFFKFRQLAFD